MVGNISKSKGFKGDAGATGPSGPQGPQGEKGQKGDTPSIVLRYDQESGDLYYNSDGILVDKEYIESQSLATKDEVNKSMNEVKTDIGNKVDKEEGMGLSTNDFTDEEKEKMREILACTLDLIPLGSPFGIRIDGKSQEICGINSGLTINMEGGSLTNAGGVFSDCLYYYDNNGYVNVKIIIDEITSNIGDIDTALDEIIAIQNSLIGGEMA